MKISPGPARREERGRGIPSSDGAGSRAGLPAPPGSAGRAIASPRKEVEVISRRFPRLQGAGLAGIGVILSLWLAVSVAASADVPAQTADPAGVPRPERHGRDRPDLPPFLEEAPRPLPLPPAPVPPPETSTSPASPQVFVRAIRWSGNTVFSDEELSHLAADLLNREISFADLEALRLRVTRHYVARGYVNSGAVIPDQEVVSGVIRVHIVEGRLSEVRVSGTRRLRAPYIQRRLVTGAGAPLNLNDLQEEVQILHQNPLIEQVHAELSPGLRLGEAVLEAEVSEASPYVLGVEAGNRWSPRVGSTGGELYAAHRNLSGWGDTLGFRYAATRGLHHLIAHYTLPVTPRDTLLRFRYEYSDAEVVEDPFEGLDITGRADTFAVEVAHPVYRTPARELSLALRGEVRHSETRILGEPFFLGEPLSSGPGVEDWESDVSVIRFTQDWLSRSRSRVFAVRSVFSVGLDAFGATIREDDLPDGRFFSWLGQVQWAGRIPALGGSQLIFRTDMQFCDRSVLPLEKFSVGGATSVRGYREDEFVRDNAVVASLELRVPVFRLPLPRLSRTGEDGIVQVAAFVDAGWSENVDTETFGPRTITSAGPGLRWDPSPGLHAELYWGIPFRDIDHGSDDLQDEGIHFQVNCLIF